MRRLAAKRQQTTEKESSLNGNITKIEAALIAFTRRDDKITADAGASLLRCAEDLSKEYDAAAQSMTPDKTDNISRTVLEDCNARRLPLDTAIDAAQKDGATDKETMMLSLGDAVFALRDAQKTTVKIERIDALARAEAALQCAIAAQLYLQLERACQPPAPAPQPPAP